jgi:hypothetical protein
MENPRRLLATALLVAALPLGNACFLDREPLGSPGPITGAAGTAPAAGGGDGGAPVGGGGGSAGHGLTGGNGGGDALGTMGRVLRPRAAATCFAGAPVPLRPIQPQASAAESCAAALSASAQWSYPSPDSAEGVDDRGRLTGRWVNCGTTTFVGPPGRGVEFGGNGRWRLLEQDPTGSLVPDTSANATGYYVVLGTGQTDIRYDDPSMASPIFFLAFTPGMDAVRFQDDFGAPIAIYARAEPSPENGGDNPPSVSDGRCSMVGTWDLPANNPTPQAPRAWITFDPAGNFTGAPVDSDCPGYTFYGTYELTPQLFQLTSNVGMGQCSWWFNAAFPATFDDRCDHLTVVQHLDNCTGGRGWFNGTTTLTRLR